MTSICPKCSTDSAVLDSRPKADGVIKRRRKCKGCGYRWSTVEIIEGRAKLINTALIQETKRAVESSLSCINKLSKRLL
jgi:transcriptional regulator NrdR family protein